MLVCLLMAGLLQFGVVAPSAVLANPDYATYYFNAYDSTTPTDWTNLPANMVDGDTGTYASTTTNLDVQLNNANTCPGTDLGTISVVELRTYGYMEADDTIELQPVFGGTVDGADYPWTPPVGEGSANWSPYFDITADGGAPGSWAWSDVQNLDVNVNYIKVGGASSTYISIVEIRVTYAPGAIEKSVSQGITIADGVTAALVAGRGVSQGITIADGVTTAIGQAKDVSQGITIADGVTAAVTRGRNVPQGITISDGVTATIARGRDVNQTISITATTSTETSFSRPVSQGITMSDGVTATFERARNVSQSLSIAATTSAEASFSRPVSQGITMSDEVTAAVGRAKDVSQTLSITATTSTEFSLGRPVSQGITIADGVTATVERVEDISQPLSLTATTSTEASFNRPVSQGITISDGVTATPAAYKPVTQGITISDGVTATVARGRNISQPLSLTATTSAEVSFVRSVSQSIAISDEEPEAPPTYISVTQGITISDGVTATVTTPTPPPPPPNGGGGAAPPPTIYAETNLFGTTTRISIGNDGKILETIETTSEDGMLTITIPRDTIALDEDGNPPSTLTSEVDVSPPSLPEGDIIIGPAYDFGPPGVTFDPPIPFTWSYDPDTFPEGVAEENLVLASYNEDAGEWLELPSTVDPVTHTITASVSHFTTFAIIARAPEVPPPAPAIFSLSNLSIQPAEVQPQEAVIITVSVANTGGMEGSYTAVLKIEGAKEAEKNVTVAAGDSQSVSFSVSREDAGSYSVVVDGLSGSFTIVALPAPPVAPALNWPLLGGIAAAVWGLLIFLGRHRISSLAYTAWPKLRAFVTLLGAAGLKTVLLTGRIISSLAYTAWPKLRALVALLGAAGLKTVLLTGRLISSLVSTALPKLRALVALLRAAGLKTTLLTGRLISSLVSTALPKLRAFVALLGAAGLRITLFVRRIISYIISRVKR